MTRVVTVFSRPGCHLCEEAIELLEGLQRPDIRVETVDIEADERLLGRYLERIPVVALDGVELYDFHVDTEDLLRRLNRLPGR